MASGLLPSTAARNLSRLLHHVPRRTTLLRRLLRQHSTTATAPSSVSADEMTHFASLASSWWDPLGPSRILHLMNPLRHEFIGSCLADEQPPPVRNDRNPGRSYLDVGCGGGIFAESLARTIPLLPDSSPSTQTDASSLLAIDPSPTMIEIAQSHARQDPTLHAHLQSGTFTYLNSTLEALLLPPAPTTSTDSTAAATTPPRQFDMITAFEVLEHVDPSTSSPRHFVQACMRLLRPGGWLVGSTIARTWPAWAVHQVLAEAPWPVGVVPRGTHDWAKFVDVRELRGWVAETEKKEEEVVVARWRCVGAVYVPGVGWRLVAGLEEWGNYFWGVQKAW
ncbi:Hexaprenyldihydroxybenzoate methyltransferase, mitochondrial [Ophidiomyces ophidiicola]|nr:Hexaprenyldihydroxybenzoate methyltransferase, mitochondrial [Ophidiomyces ophidiicola]